MAKGRPSASRRLAVRRGGAGEHHAIELGIRDENVTWDFNAVCWGKAPAGLAVVFKRHVLLLLEMTSTLICACAPKICDNKNGYRRLQAPCH
jgi:hypothetical protein